MVESAVLEASAPPVAARRISPAAHLAERFAAAEVTSARGVSVREVPFQTLIGIRAELGSAAAKRLSEALLVDLPARCGAVAYGDRLQVVWFAPDEFLVVAEEAPASLTARLVDTLGDEPGAVVDLSANRTCFELAGPSARAVLEKGCSLDLHPRAFAVGAAYVSSLRAVPVLLWKTGPETYRIFPRSSFADFLGRWLIDAMAEFAAPELP